MSTSAPNPTGGEEAFAYFVTEQVPKIVEMLIQAQRIAQQHALKEIQAQAADLALVVIKDINEIAVKMAGYADGAIVRKMFESHTAERPITGDMESHVLSLPGPLGSVQVALLSELDKIINPNGYGPFWRAQEYGTGSDEVVSQVGRPLYGTFEPSDTPPQGALRGLGVGRDIRFVPGGADPGLGTISTDLPGRHFLRDGATEAGERYVQEMQLAQSKWVARIHQLQAELRNALTSRGVFTATLKA